MMKYYLMAPGPSMIPERVLLEMAKPIIHHRTKAFESVMGLVREQLKALFQTKNEVLLQASVGSGGMEAALVNCFSPGESIVVIESGKFGERWSDQGKAFGLNVIDVEIPWGQCVKIEDIENLLKKNPEIKGVLCQACETSTGVAHPIKELGALIKKYPETILLIDAITALGISDIRTDEWNLDVVVTGSQKALMLPPGLSLLSFSEKAMKRHKTAKLPRYYFNIDDALKAQLKNQTYFTPPISLIMGLHTSLDMILEETLPKLFKRHQRLAAATRAGIIAMGLELFSKAPSDSVTVVCAPSGIDGDKVVSHLLDKYNFSIIGGQDQIKGKVFRIGHMGYCGDFDVISMIAATEMALKDLGFKGEIGKGVAATTQSLYGELGN
jgi:aspartate aminotransferase-like enzyme